MKYLYNLGIEHRDKINDIEGPGTDRRGASESGNPGQGSSRLADSGPIAHDPDVYRWLAKGVAGLSDAPRSGAPSKLSLEQLEQLKAWASEDALTATALLTRLEEKFGVRVHVNTLTGALKRAGLVWKRTRHSLKKTQ
jgi:predicted DNA-binding ribbon-helix-helix protein